MTLIDTHAHLDMPQFDADRTAVLQRAREAGLDAVVCVGTDLASSRRCVRLEEGNPGFVRAAVGIHPHEWGQGAADFDAVAELARAPGVVAIGETGLDFHYDLTPRDLQAEGLRRHVRLALEVDRPLILHCRKADDEALGILEGRGPGLRGVRHCFDGRLPVAERYIELGFYISFAGQITRDGYKKLKAAARALPLDRILVETDCPYQTPAAHAPGRCEPAFVAETVRSLAELRSCAPEEIAEATSANARRLFRLPDATVA